MEHARTSTFIELAIEEAHDILIGLRNYNGTSSRQKEIYMSKPSISLEIITLQLQMVTRLGWVLAWLMYRKAVNAGELSEREALSRLGDWQKWDATAGKVETNLVLPAELHRLLNHGNTLFGRISRLDALARRNLDEGGPLGGISNTLRSAPWVQIVPDPPAGRTTRD